MDRNDALQPHENSGDGSKHSSPLVFSPLGMALDSALFLLPGVCVSQSPGVSCAHDWGILLHSSLFSDWLLCRLKLQSFQASALFLLTVLSCCLLCVPTMITVTLLWAESEVDYRVEFVAYSPIIDHSSSLMTVDVGETGLIKKYNLFLS